MITKDNLNEIANVSFNDILEEAYNLLKARGWNVTREGIEIEMKHWLKAKSNKIEEMIKSPYYNGNLQLIIPAEINRDVASDEARTCLVKIINSVNANENVRCNERSQTATERLKELIGNVPEHINANDDITSYSLASAIEQFKNEFNDNMICMSKLKIVNLMKDSLNAIHSNLSERINENLAETLNAYLHLEKKKIITGQKTSKVVNRILHLGTYEKYNSMFVEFSDLITHNALKGYYVVSVNFLDYLRMSDGHSWSSCHSTDPQNTRRMSRSYEGQYCQGCLSYANDEVTYMTYFVDKDADVAHPDRADKLYRECMHLRNDNELLINGRIYPQGNDGQTDIYKTLLELFFTVINGLELKDRGVAKEIAYITTSGANYPDYYYNRQCRLYIVDDNDDYSITIGDLAYSCADGFELDRDIQNSII